MHDAPLLTTLASAFTAAWVLGLVTQRIGLSPIVGYLLAGVLVGPHTPGFVADTQLARQLAELGVILLLFGVGLHFHPRDLLAVRKMALPGSLGHAALITLASLAVFTALGMAAQPALLVGLALSIASTVVALRLLTDTDRLATPAGHGAVGWLIVEDLIAVVVLVILPSLAGPHGGLSVAAIALALAKLAAMTLVVLVGGRLVVPRVLVRVAGLRSPELFTLTVLVLSIAVATGASLAFGASAALGAFLAGMVVGQSPVSQQAGADALPLRDAFAVLFFVSVGMLFDPRFVLEEPGLLLAGLGLVLVAKLLLAIGLVAVLGHPARTGLTVAASMAQVGEFSFILGELAQQLGLLPASAMNLLVACALVSITVNPLLFRAIDPTLGWLQRHRFWLAALSGRAERQAILANAQVAADVEHGPHAIIVGYGPVGRQVDELLRKAGRDTVIIDLNIDAIAALRASGRRVLYGDASRREILDHAGVAQASHVILTMPASSDRASVIATAKALNPDAQILVRLRYLRDVDAVRRLGASGVVVDELEAAVALTELVLAHTGANAGVIAAEAARVRLALHR